MIASLIGKIVSKPAVADWLLARAKRTPDDPIVAGDGSGDIYMYRHWLFNPLVKKGDGKWVRKWRFIPFSIRVHNIMLPDADRHLHDHPFNARTWIMKGGYEELRAEDPDIFLRNQRLHMNQYRFIDDDYMSPSNDDLIGVVYARHPGDSTTLTYQRFHKITRIYDEQNGALTLFMFGGYKGPWGFLVNGAKVYYRDYIKARSSKAKK